MKQVDCVVSRHSKDSVVRKINVPPSIFEQRHLFTEIPEFARQKPAIVFHERNTQFFILEVER
jgi:hypothetical protein